ITERGREELIDWLRQPTSFQPKMKDENLLRVSLLQLLPLEEAIRYVEETKSHHEQVAQQIRAFQEAHQSKDDTLGYLLTSEYAIRMMENYAGWADWAIEQMKQRDKHAT
ncbi:MAG: PadR family transcriptional regulator, partial [Exiguobacterium sp.]|nr:PadR family transcriptional regulator [Exiguobacterium sp.]